MERKGIILAGGTGSRLYPITLGVSKQLLPVYDKPMIYYPISTLMLAGIEDILIITTPLDILHFKQLLGDGSNWGIQISYEIQTKPRGIAEAFLIGEKFINKKSVALILGDNLFHGEDLTTKLRQCSKINNPTIFAYQVHDPQRYGVIEFSDNGKVISIEEKPTKPKSSYAITGLYFFDESVTEKAKMIKPSKRGELEITDINKMYLLEDNLKVELLSRGMAWLDTGTCDSLHEASSYIKTIENRQGLKVGCPEEIAFKNGWIDNDKLKVLATPLHKSGYGKYLINLINTNQNEVD
ncbi:MAG: glucose-1-phosphate thymidylyltransferase [Candidatus Pelagibacter sp.]|nr:glucose-1-phosphate thymidylyltransferase [Candidatus Pelagibacter sp.]|tara:strand:+ start:1657 stop:2544 length:888 start_codon:yes stop_codon:yes gene_type:complete